VVAVGEDDDASGSASEWQVGQQVEAATAAGTDADHEAIDGTQAEGLEGASGGTSGEDVRVSLQAARDASAAGPVAKYEYPGDVLPLALGRLGGPTVSMCFGLHARRSISFRFDAVRTADRRRSNEHGLACNSCTPRARLIGAAPSHRVTTTTRLGRYAGESGRSSVTPSMSGRSSSGTRTSNRRCSRSLSSSSPSLC
jgi:hypothetical protein